MSALPLSEYLPGAWRLLDWRIEYDDGRITYPFGADALGQIMYTCNGGMSATISAAGRTPLSTQNVRDADASEQASAFGSYFHYAGRWRIEGSSVIHQVELSLNPAFVDTELARQVDVVSAEQMALSAMEQHGEQGSRRHIIEWQRLPSL